MTSFEDARRRVSADLSDVAAAALPSPTERRRAQLRAGAHGAVAAATAGAMTMTPAGPALAAEEVPVLGRLQPAEPAPADPAPAPVEHAPAPAVPEGGHFEILVPLDGRESVAPPPPVNDNPIVPGGGRPTAPILTPLPVPESLPVPEAAPSSPSAPAPAPPPAIVVVAAPAPAPAGGGSTDITVDFSDPDAGEVVAGPGIPLQGAATYVVQLGDNLWTIAEGLLIEAAYTVTVSLTAEAVATLHHRNSMVIGSNPDLIEIGMVLDIPDPLVATTTADQD